MTDPLADVLHQAEHEWRIGGQAGEWQDVLARAAREHLIGKVRAIPPRPWDENDADSAEARSARAYASGLADAIRAIGATDD